MKYFITMAYITMSGNQLFDNDIVEIPEVTMDVIRELEKGYENIHNARNGKLKIISLTKL